MATPFPARSQNPFESSAWWLTDTLLGDLAIGLCVIAVAVVGLLMMGGRLPLRLGAKVALGCFVLLGAPVIASGFLTLGEAARGASAYAN
ncbi:MAG: TrbC/VirB2 family protein [Erythrobacter sp.]|jgi:type IV secretory pathway VirB2 component (pilin)|nr:TrbC/VirB2 family protein [Erythrobacter sp.]